MFACYSTESLQENIKSCIVPYETYIIMMHLGERDPHWSPIPLCQSSAGQTSSTLPLFFSEHLSICLPFCTSGLILFNCTLGKKLI